MFTNQKRSWMFWVLSPFLLAFIIFMPVLPFVSPEWNTEAFVVLATVEILSILVFIGFLEPVRFSWAWRGVGAIVFGCFIVYLIAMLVESGGHFTVGKSRSEMTVFNALVGLVLFGVPGLIYAIFGRFSIHKKVTINDSSQDEEYLSDLSKPELAHKIRIELLEGTKEAKPREWIEITEDGFTVKHKWCMIKPKPRSVIWQEVKEIHACIRDCFSCHPMFLFFVCSDGREIGVDELMGWYSTLFEKVLQVFPEFDNDVYNEVEGYFPGEGCKLCWKSN